MDKDLFFIHLIQQAFQKANPKHSLTQAMHKIKEIGSKDPYKIGFLQFEYFMSQSVESIQDSGIQLNEKWFLHDADTPVNDYPESQDLLSIELVKNEKQIKKIFINKIPSVFEFPNVVPGNYILRLNTGRILWVGVLDYKHLHWAIAFTDKPFQAAAQTDETQIHITIDEWLLDDEIRLQVIPGIETGKIRIEIQKSKRKS